MLFAVPITKSPLHEHVDALGIVVSVRVCDIDADPGEYVPEATVTDAAHERDFVPSAPCVMTFVPLVRVSEYDEAALALKFLDAE